MLYRSALFVSAAMLGAARTSDAVCSGGELRRMRCKPQYELGAFFMQRCFLFPPFLAQKLLRCVGPRKTLRMRLSVVVYTDAACRYLWGLANSAARPCLVR